MLQSNIAMIEEGRKVIKMFLREEAQVLLLHSEGQGSNWKQHGK